MRRAAVRARARRLGALLVGALAVVVLLPGCGDDGSGGVPQGNPDARHGAEAVDDYAAVELLRALLVASSDAYYAGAPAADARAQLERAAAAYAAMAPDVRSADPVLHREVAARFELLERELARGVVPDRYRDLSGPLADQLTGGVQDALVPSDARSDPGVKAIALRRVTARMAAVYDAAVAGTGDDRARLAFEEAWGLWRRALSLTSSLKPDLGDQKDTVAGSLNDLRDPAFPEGPIEPPEPDPERVHRAAATVERALQDRFGTQKI